MLDVIKLLSALLFIGLIIFFGVVPGFIGLYLAFKASLLLGVLAAIIEPVPMVIGLFYMLSGGVTNLAPALQEILNHLLK